MRAALLALLMLPGCTKSGPQQQQQAEPPIENEMPPAPNAMATPAAESDFRPTNLSGIWQGTVGTRPVRACFVEWDYATYGAYYDLSRLGQPVGLDAVDGTPDAWREAGRERTPVWRDVQATATTLTARWTRSGQTLPVRLRRVAGAAAGGEDGPCSSIDFHRPRLAGVRTVRTRGRVDGVAYTKLALDTRGHFNIEVQTFALDGTSPAIRRINAALDEGLRGDPPAWFFCISNTYRDRSGEGESSERTAPMMLSRRWLSVDWRGSFFCGGAHPGFGETYSLFDLTSGAAVELLNWFLPTAVKHERVTGMEEDFLTLQPAFRAFLLASWHSSDAECAQAIRNQDTWTAGLKRDGIVFQPNLPHVWHACGREFVIPFDRIRPWLTREGAAAVTALRAERR